MDSVYLCVYLIFKFCTVISLAFLTRCATCHERDFLLIKSITVILCHSRCSPNVSVQMNIVLYYLIFGCLWNYFTCCIFCCLVCKDHLNECDFCAFWFSSLSKSLCSVDLQKRKCSCRIISTKLPHHYLWKLNIGYHCPSLWAPPNSAAPQGWLFLLTVKYTAFAFCVDCNVAVWWYKLLKVWLCRSNEEL